MPRELRPLDGDLHPSDAAYLRHQLRDQRGIRAVVREAGERSRLWVDAGHAKEAEQLRDLLLGEPDAAPSRERRGLASKPLAAGALVAMSSLVLASRLGSYAAGGALGGLALGGITFAMLRSRAVRNRA